MLKCIQKRLEAQQEALRIKYRSAVNEYVNSVDVEAKEIDRVIIAEIGEEFAELDTLLEAVKVLKGG